MSGQEPVHVSLQLPAGALDGLARLTEQLRLLAEAFRGSQAAPDDMARERGENTAFDWAKFQALGVERTLPDPAAARSGTGDAVPGARPAREAVSSGLPQPDGASGRVEGEVGDPAQAEAPSGGAGDAAEAVLPEVRELEQARAAREAASAALADAPAPAAAAGVEAVSPPPAAGGDAESPVVDAPAAKVEASAVRDAPAAARMAFAMDGAAPQRAGVHISAGPEAAGSRWSGVSEDAPPAAPPALTAEDVSLAFQRDGRRYDGGFPFY